MRNLRAVPPGDGNGPELYESDDLITQDPTGHQGRSKRVSAEFRALTRDWIDEANATWLRDRHDIGSYGVEGIISGYNGQSFVVIVHGVIDDGDQAGLRRSDTVKKAGYDAIMIRRLRPMPVLLFTSHLPGPISSVSSMLSDCASDVFDVFRVFGDGSLADFHRLKRYLHDVPFPGQLEAAWRDNPSQWTPELFDSPDQPVTQAKLGDNEEVPY